MIKKTNKKYRRKSLRLPEYDYSQSGAYFITICTNHGELLLEPKEVKELIILYLQELHKKFPNIIVDEFSIMPNHIHTILFISVGADPCVCPPNHKNKKEHTDSIQQPISSIIQWFKTMTTNYYIQNVKNNGWKPFKNKLWQRNYYERIIRDEKELNGKRKYIIENPLKWELDKENPANW